MVVLVLTRDEKKRNGRKQAIEEFRALYKSRSTAPVLRKRMKKFNEWRTNSDMWPIYSVRNIKALRTNLMNDAKWKDMIEAIRK